jgi:hypothetical protein
MHNPNSSVLLAASLCAVASAQDRIFDSNQRPAPAAEISPLALDGGGGGGPRDAARVTAVGDPSLDRLFGPDSGLLLQSQQQQQGGDRYSPHALFQGEHGDFMLKYQRFTPQIQLRGELLPHSEVQHQPGSFRMIRFTGDAQVKLTVGPDGYAVVGGFFEQRNYDTSGMAGFPDENLYSVGVNAGFGLFLDKNLLLEALVQPGYWSDFDGGTNREDFDMPSKAILTYRADNDLFLKAGVRYNQVYQDANVLPYLGVSWQPNENFRLDVLAPEMVEASLWPTPDLGFLLGTQIEGARYHVRSSAATGKHQANTRVQEILVYGGALWRFTENTSLQMRTGIAAAGDYKLDDGDPATPRVAGTLQTSFFVDVTFGFDF